MRIVTVLGCVGPASASKVHKVSNSNIVSQTVYSALPASFVNASHSMGFSVVQFTINSALTHSHHRIGVANQWCNGSVTAHRVVWNTTCRRWPLATGMSHHCDPEAIVGGKRQWVSRRTLVEHTLTCLTECRGNRGFGRHFVFARVSHSIAGSIIMTTDLCSTAKFVSIFSCNS